jgi:predicted nucleic acid-binding Zn ribbon protein
MPIYVYEYVNPDGTPGESFELIQSMSEPALAKHPESGKPIRRVFGTPNAPKKWTDSHGKNATSDRNLERTGFTKYVKGDNGKYKKLFGKGPDQIRKPPQG